MLRFLGWSSRSWSVSFRLVSVPLGLLLVAGYQFLQGGPQARSLPLVVLTPCRPHLFALAVCVGPHRLFPELFPLGGIYVSLPSSALDHGVELHLNHLPVRCVHHAPFVV